MGGLVEFTRRHAPYLGPYFAAKAAEDALAVWGHLPPEGQGDYAAELTRFGIETTIVVPGSFTSGTNHFADAGGAHGRVHRDRL